MEKSEFDEAQFGGRPRDLEDIRLIEALRAEEA
jgi:hypothetical protein